MINKLYHCRKISAAKGVNRVGNMKGVDPTKSAVDIVNQSINNREKINITAFDIFVFKYLQCGCYKMFTGPKYYKGKIIYEGRQRLKNDADVGNIV